MSGKIKKIMFSKAIAKERKENMKKEVIMKKRKDVNEILDLEWKTMC